MIDHTNIRVSADEHKSVVAWYEVVLKPLGYKKLLAFGPNEEAVGFGDGRLPHHPMHTDFWITATPEKSSTTVHHAFGCKGE